VTAPSSRVARTILTQLHCISLPTPFPVGDVNVYLVEGTPLTLIDCGVNGEESWQALENGIAALGYKVSDIQRLIITHHHTDHLGAAAQVVKESGAEVWAHPLAVRWLEKPRDARLELRRFTDMLYRDGGIPQPQIDTMNQVAQYLESLATPVRVTMTVDEGELLEMMDTVWQVYHTPGHAGDLICFYQPDSKVLLSSDHLLRDVSSNPLIEGPDHPGDPRPKRLVDYIREMKRIGTLDIQVAYAGHGDPILEVRKLIDSRLEFHEKRANKLMEILRSQPRTLYELGQIMFPRVRETELFLVISEVLGHIDVLEQRGQVVPQRYNGVIYWSLA